MTGYELLKTVRSDDALKNTPFIMVTAESKTDNVIAAKKAGVNSYIVKPFNAQTLQGQDRSHLRRLTRRTRTGTRHDAPAGPATPRDAQRPADRPPRRRCSDQPRPRHRPPRPHARAPLMREIDAAADYLRFVRRELAALGANELAKGQIPAAAQELDYIIEDSAEVSNAIMTAAEQVMAARRRIPRSLPRLRGRADDHGDRAMRRAGHLRAARHAGRRLCCARSSGGWPASPPSSRRGTCPRSSISSPAPGDPSPTAR